VTKMFLLDLCLYYKQCKQLTLSDYSDLHSPLEEICLYERDNTVPQSQEWMDYLDSIGIAWKGQNHWHNPNIEQCVDPLKTWIDYPEDHGKLDCEDPFPFAVARFVTVSCNGSSSEVISRFYTDLNDLKADGNISVNQL